MLQGNPGAEVALIRTVVGGDAEAAEKFLQLMSPVLWSVVVKLEGEGPDGEAAFLHIIAALKADGYQRLKSFDGQARLATYLAVVARDILADRLARSFVETPRAAWRRFERFFSSDIRRRIVRRFPREAAAREDVYQEICLKFVEDDYRRVRAYDGRGSFTGYVLTVVERILIDLVRRDAPRRRLPASITRLSVLDQEVYAAIAWENCPADAERVAGALRGRLEADPGPAEIREAIGRVAAIAQREVAASARSETVSLELVMEDLSVADPGLTPEDQVLLAEEEQSRGALIAAIKSAAADLPADERLYLQVVFSASDPLPPREIAKLMGCAVEDVYRLKQRAQRWMAEIAARLGKSRTCPSDVSKGRTPT